MTKFILSTLIALAPVVALAQVNTIRPDLIETFGARKNYIRNPSAARNVAGVAISSATVTRSTVIAADGIASFTCTTTTTNGFCEWLTNTINSPDEQGECQASFSFRGDASLYSIQVSDGTSTLAQRPLSNATGVWRDAVVNYPCGTPRTVRISKTTAGTDVALQVSRVYWGKASNFGSVSQATLYGRAVWVPTTSCIWSASSTSFANYAVDADCTTPVGSSLANFATAPATKVPGFTFASLPPGDYILVARGLVYKNNSVNDNALVRWHDGTNGAGDQIVASANGVGALGATGNVTGSFTYTTVQSNITFQLQARNVTTAGAIEIQANVTPLTLELYRYPTSAEAAFRPDILPASYSGQLTGGTAWGTTSASFVDVTAAGWTLTANANSTRNMTVTQMATNPGVTFAPPRAGNYLICSTAGVTNTNASSSGVFQLTDGTNTIIAGQIFTAATASAGGIVGGCASWNAASTASASIRWQVRQLNNTAQIQGPVTFSITALDAPMAAPILNQTISTTSPGIERIERVRVSAVCTTTPCTIADSTPSVTSVSRGAVGNYTVNFAAGTFTAAPVCSVLTSGVGNTTSAINSETATAINFLTFAGSTAASTDVSFRLICFGPR